MADLVRIAPVVFLPGVNNIEQSFTKDDTDIKRLYTVANSLRGLYVSGTPPTSPNNGDLWRDSSVTPNILKEWNGSSWITFLEPTTQLTQILNEKLGANIASASTINLTTATGNFLHITGTTTITAVTLGAGMRREVIFDGILTLTHHTTNNNLPSAANITTAVGDRASYYSDGTTVYCTKYVKADGTAVVAVVPTVGGEILQLRITNNTTTPNTKMDIVANNVPLYDASYNQKKSGVISLTADLGTSGVNGLDTGTKANSTAYFLYVIGKADGTMASLWSLSATTPTMPTDYIYKRRVGWNRTDSSGNIYRISQIGNKAKYVVTPATNTATLPVMASGTAGSISVPTWVGVSVSTFIPSTSPIVKITAGAFNGTILVAPNNSYGAYNASTNLPPISSANAATFLTSQLADIELESTNIYWANNAPTVAIISCVGWEDEI